MMNKAVILGATGPTGNELARVLTGRGVDTRVVSRSAERLDAMFGDVSVERAAHDLLSSEGAARAVAGCDTAFVCVGLPLDQIEAHGEIARRVTDAAGVTGTRIVHVSSYWGYLPQQGPVISEDHPRRGGGLPIRARREAEDLYGAAGAAVVNLPDFYGPYVHVSTLQMALREAVAGKPMRWVGGRTVAREYVYIPDAMRIVVDLALRDEAYGRRWVVPTAGPLNANDVADIAERALGRPVKVQAAGLWLLRAMSLFSSQLRALLPLLPSYASPVHYDGSRLQRLIGEVPATPYAMGIGSTLEWLQR